MPKKKTGQRKKVEKQKLRQKEIRSAKELIDLGKFPCNAAMVVYYLHFIIFINDNNCCSNLCTCFYTGMRQVQQEAKEPSLLLLLSKRPKTSNVCTLWQSQVYVENRRLRGQARWSFHHRSLHGREYHPLNSPNLQ